ncbi:MAG: hypothetical protein H7A51_14620 [Akkermansiaceae bacterium]|nr:hypothetical protein [Akkermansiaceae bacterium]
MKNTSKPHLVPQSARLIVAAGVAITTLCMTTPDADAQRRPGPGLIPKRGGGPIAERRLGIDFGEIGAIRDKFAAYKRLTFGGAAYYTKQDGHLRVAHFKTYMLIRNSLVEDRLDEEAGRNAVEQLLAIGKEAKRLRGDNDALSQDDATKINGKIRTLAERVGKERGNKVPADALTPRVNERQATLEEAFLFGVDSKALSAGQAATLRRYMSSLESKEDRAKDDDKVTDREREKLVEETVEIWKKMVKALNP